MELATLDEVAAYRRTNNQPDRPVKRGEFLGSEYNPEVGTAAEEETWKQYLGNRLLRDWQQPYDGIIPLRNGKDIELAEGMRQVQVKTRTWEKKSGGHNYYNITLPSHDRMASNGFYHFWVHTVPEEPEPVDDELQQYDLEWNPVGADEDERPLTYDQIRDAMTFHADAVFTWKEIDALITYADERHNDPDNGITGVGFSTDNYGNTRVGIQVPLMFEYRDALEIAHDVYGDEEAARQDALRRIDNAPAASEALGTIDFYS